MCRHEDFETGSAKYLVDQGSSDDGLPVGSILNGGFQFIARTSRCSVWKKGALWTQNRKRTST
jgi:hypothetical protein